MDLVLSAWHVFLFVAVVVLIAVAAAFGAAVVAIIVRAAVTSLTSPRKERSRRE